MQPSLDPQVVNLAKAIRQTESGGNFNAVGKSGEFGAYQFTEPTWKAQASKYGINVPLKQATPEQQNAVAYNQIKEWKDSGHNVAQIASMWNAGQGEPDSYTGKFSNGKPSTGVNSYGVKFSVPDYAYSVANAYQSIKGGSTPGIDPNNPSAAQTDPTQTEGPGVLKKIGDFLTGGTQKFGNTIGESIAAPQNAQMFSDAYTQHNDITNNLNQAIKNKVSKGEDVTALQLALKQHLQTTPSLQDFTGDVINKTAKQVVGEGAMSGLEALSGGILEGGAKTIAAKELSIGGKLAAGAKIGAGYGAISGAAGAMSNNESLGGIAGSTLGGAAIGGALGGAVSGAGVIAGKTAGFIDKSGLLNKILPQTEERINKLQGYVDEAKQATAKAYKDSLPLTPREQLREQNLLNKKGDNVYTTLAEYNINPGSPEALSHLTTVSDQFENAINHAKTNEHALFNVDEMKNRAFAEINERLNSETARGAAKAKIEGEIDALLKANKGSVFSTPEGTKVDANLMERLRKTGNDWTPFNASDPEKIGKSSGWALANAVRDQVEKEGTFPAYREANREWGKVIHAEQVLTKITDSGKPFKTVGGLGGSIARKVLSGALGFHSAGIAGLVLSELGSEYSAKLLSNPTLRTLFNRTLIERFGNTKATPEAILKLENEIRMFLDRQGSMPRLEAPSTIYVPPTQGGKPYTPNQTVLDNPVAGNNLEISGSSPNNTR